LEAVVAGKVREIAIAREVLDLYQKRSGGVHFVEVDNAAAPERF
jgi:hypothetical protein